jgi:hypothetical protein
MKLCTFTYHKAQYPWKELPLLTTKSSSHENDEAGGGEEGKKGASLEIIGTFATQSHGEEEEIFGHLVCASFGSRYFYP